MKKYFIQLYGNCDFQRCCSDLKLVLTFGTPNRFIDLCGKYSPQKHWLLGSPRCFVPWPLITGWAGGVRARDVDVGIPSHTQRKTEKVSESLMNIAWLCCA